MAKQLESDEDTDNLIAKPLSLSDDDEVMPRKSKQISCLWLTLIVSWIVMGSIIAYLSYSVYTLNQDIPGDAAGTAPNIIIDRDACPTACVDTSCCDCCGRRGTTCSVAGDCCEGLGCSATTLKCDICVEQGQPCTSEDVCCQGACFEGSCFFMGRPYNILSSGKKGLSSAIHLNGDNDKCNYDILNDGLNKKYIDALLSEHASIGTFNKFSIELMNLGAPLWLNALSQKAALDEINHANIMSNILNGLLNGNNSNDKCVEIGAFPNHNIEFDGDCNKVSLDVVNGGCFGETMASMETMKQAKDYNELHSVAMDEVRHSALAWSSAKWMMDHCDGIQISEYEWWQSKVKQNPLFEKMFHVFWTFEGQDYRDLYDTIHDMLKKEVIAVSN